MRLRSSPAVAPDPVVAEPTDLELSADFLAEQKSYRGVREEHRRLQTEAEGARAVATLDGMSRADREQRQVAHLNQKAAAFLAGRTLTARELARALETTDEAVVTHEPTVEAAKHRFYRARDAEILRLAHLLKPDHRAAVLQLARALEVVSAAIEAERAVRAKLTAAGIGDAPAVLPDTSAELGLGTFDEWNSRLSEWRRKYHVLGVLK